jgi:hypothetical protein
LPWQRDDCGDHFDGRICTWPEADIQSGSVIGLADVTSHEGTTRKWLEKWGTNRGLRPPIRTCSTSGDVEGAANCEPHNDRATAEDRDVDLQVFNAA